MSKLKLACEATLLFHSASPWDFEKQQRWQQLGCELLGEPRFKDFHYARRSMKPTTFEATTRMLCDMIRAAMDSESTTSASTVRFESSEGKNIDPATGLIIHPKL